MLNLIIRNIYGEIYIIYPVPIPFDETMRFSAQEVWQHGGNWPFMFRKNLWNLQRMGSICTHVVSMDTCHVSAELCLGKQCQVSDLNQRLKMSASLYDWHAGSLGGWLSWAGLLRAEVWRPWLLHPWCDGETWPSRKRRWRPLLKAKVPQGDILMHDGWNKIKWDQPSQQQQLLVKGRWLL